jgi:hypothetical protein
MANKRKVAEAVSGNEKEHDSKCVHNRSVCEHLTDLQKDPVCFMEFGSMLDIKCTTLHNPLIYLFVKLYNKKTQEFIVPSHDRIPPNEASARRTLGLPIGSVPVPYCTDGRLEHSLALVVFSEDYKTPTTSRVWEILKYMDDDGGIFKLIYVMYLVSTMLSPTTRNHVSNRCYPIMVSSSSLIAYVSCKAFYVVVRWITLTFQSR